MGSASAMESIHRVLEAHGEEIAADYKKQLQVFVAAVLNNADATVDVSLQNNVYAIEVLYELVRDGRIIETLEGPYIDVDTLADDYPDCDVGY